MSLNLVLSLIISLIGLVAVIHFGRRLSRNWNFKEERGDNITAFACLGCGLFVLCVGTFRFLLEIGILK